MYVFVPFVFIVAIAFCFLFFDWLSFQRKNSNAGFFSILILGLLFSILLALSPFWNPSGFPLRNIKQGTYKVAFVYVADENVNVAIEWKTDAKDAVEKIYYYQFKKDAFEGILNSNSKKLVVVETGNFKKLRLE